MRLAVRLQPASAESVQRRSTFRRTRCAVRRTRCAFRRTRCAFTLLEVLVAVAITALASVTAMRLLGAARRVAWGAATLSDQRAQLAVAAYVLESELLGVAPGDGDLVAGSDSSVVYQSTVGSALACEVGTSTIDVADDHIASGARITAWNTAPQPGDSVALFDEGSSAGASDDRWHHAALTGITSLTAACLHSPFVDSVADAASVGWRLALGAAVPATVTPGATLRVSRLTRVALYRASGEWMLGWTERNASTGAWHTIQPIAGPLLPYASTGATSGLAIRWLDSLGAPTPANGGTLPRSASISIAATTRDVVRMDGVARGVHRDSLRLYLPLRNAR